MAEITIKISEDKLMELLKERFKATPMTLREKRAIISKKELSATFINNDLEKEILDPRPRGNMIYASLNSTRQDVFWLNILDDDRLKNIYYHIVLDDKIENVYYFKIPPATLSIDDFIIKYTKSKNPKPQLNIMISIDEDNRFIDVGKRKFDFTKYLVKKYPNMTFH